MLYLLNPKCWFRTLPTNRKWNRWMTRSLEAPRLENFRRDVIRLNGVDLDISNYPRFYGSKANGGVIGLPSRRNAAKLKLLIEDWLITQKFICPKCKTDIVCARGSYLK